LQVKIDCQSTHDPQRHGGSTEGWAHYP